MLRRIRQLAAVLVLTPVAIVGVVLDSVAEQSISTYSIVAYDPEAGDLGVAVQSKFFAVGSVVPWAKAGVGAIASQAYGNPTFGPEGLDLLQKGFTVHGVLDALLADDPQREQRQIGIVDANGAAAAFTGSECQPWAGHEMGSNFSVQGNILVSEATVHAMASAFTEAGGMLGERLMRALEAGQAAGGDSRGMQSAAMLIVREGGGYGGYNDRYCDLRVDDHENPIAELRRIFDMWKEHALVLEGYRLCEAGDWDGAFSAGLEAIAMSPADGEPRYHLACYYSKAGKREEALAELAKAVELDSTLAPRARQDPDFKPLYEDQDFLGITGD